MWPFRHDAVAQGCTCRWHGHAAIIVFDPTCPIGYKHRGNPYANVETWGQLNDLWPVF